MLVAQQYKMQALLAADLLFLPTIRISIEGKEKQFENGGQENESGRWHQQRFAIPAL